MLEQQFSVLNACLTDPAILRVLVAANAENASVKHHGHGNEHTRSHAPKQKHSDDEKDRFKRKGGTNIKPENVDSDEAPINYVTVTHAPAQIKQPVSDDTSEMTNFMSRFEGELDESATGSDVTNAARVKK